MKVGEKSQGKKKNQQMRKQKDIEERKKEWNVADERERYVHENDIFANENSICAKFQQLVTLVTLGIAKKNTLRGSRIKFYSISG